MKTYLYRASSLNSTHFSGLSLKAEVKLWRPPKTIVTCDNCCSPLYVGLARAVSLTNTNFRLTLLLTRLQEAQYKDLP